MRAEILCVGTELLLGDIVNTNAVYIAKELASIGVNVYHQAVVGDNTKRLKEQLARSFSQCDLVVLTGGLGPTYDDLTKETVAELFHREMEFNQEAYDGILRRFLHSDRQMTDNNRKQAYLPVGAIPLQNQNGTAPGLILEDKKENKTAVLLPGPPREMEPMFSNQVVPYLKKKTNATLVSHSIHIFGLGESYVESQLHDFMEQSQNPTLAPYAKEGEVLLRVTASAKSRDEADEMMAPVIQKVKNMFGENVYGVDIGSLQAALVAALQAKGLKVAAAESCTGGLVSKRITEVAGASQVFDCGVCSYANRIKEQVLGVSRETLETLGAVSKETAAQMAAGVRKLSKADIGVSTTGIAGPDGGTEEKPVGLVYVGVDSENYTTVLECRLSRGYDNERELIRYLASSHALRLALTAAEKAAKKN